MLLGIAVPSFVWLHSTPSCGWTTACLSFPVENIGVNVMDYSCYHHCGQVCVYTNVLIWGANDLGVGFPSHVVSVCLTSYASGKHFPRVVMPFSIATKPRLALRLRVAASLPAPSSLLLSQGLGQLRGMQGDAFQFFHRIAEAMGELGA